MSDDSHHCTDNDKLEYTQLAENIKCWGKELGFQQVAVSDINLDEAERHLVSWLNANFHGSMAYMARHGTKRTHPQELLPGTLRVITARMDYYPLVGAEPEKVLQDSKKGFISRYTLGRDYHKLVRKRLQQLANKIEDVVSDVQYRVFTDSAPVMERALAEKSGLGWIGKHTNLINQHAGSWFFLGEIYTDIPLPTDTPAENHCGTCTACINICPTQAIIAPYKLDARRCISYLTIELKGAIPVEYRKAIGNRIYGCDDCQLVCPWNRFAKPSIEPDFSVRHGLDAPDLISLFSWSEQDFLRYTEGSAIRRIGYISWLRNIAIAMGNAPVDGDIIQALKDARHHDSEIVREHVRWALAQHEQS
jgi:epoxyqueuosine reductase